ncbi:MAG: endolytic transglycosylase MltG [Candidatus Nomurabacteria bacterium]|jgi:UPF0755 protein|nr:endolytic transglycosylase MltG [Candidatus Nomurabacteria bacterium]
MASSKLKIIAPKSPKKIIHAANSKVDKPTNHKPSSHKSIVLKKRKKIPRRRPSFDISRSFVEMNFAVLMGPELTVKEAKKARKIEKKIARHEARRRHRVRNAILSFICLLIISASIAMAWWTTSLQPINKDDTRSRQFIVDKGATTDQIATALQKGGFIKNATVFKIYVRLNSIVIQAGTHLLSPSYSVPEIANKLTQALIDEVEIQVPPGLTLKQLRSTWKKHGYTEAEISAAYSASYKSSLLDDRPSNLPIERRLEGYIYPDTYRVYSSDKLEVVIQKAIDQFEQVATKNDLRAKFKAQKLTFYEGLTLASIIEKEVSSETDRKKVSGVFFNRIKVGEQLGADATYKYAFAEGLCSIDGPGCNSAYNTRKHAGFPPGPISNVNLTALVAVAEPTSHNYFYYVSGDNGKNYFSRTIKEHEANISKYCRKLCR